MLGTPDLTVTDSGSVTKPGAEGAKVYASVASLTDGSLRRIPANALTVPHTMSVKHSLSGTGFKQRARSVVRFDITRLDTDPTTTGGVTPTVGVYLVIDRPVQSGGNITAAHIQTLVGAVADVCVPTASLDKLLNMEA
jgi:hypothetical protein